MSPTNWEELKSKFDQGGTSTKFVFPKEGRTKVRLLWNDEKDKVFFAPVETNFRGKIREKFLVLCFVPDDDADVVIKAVLLPRSVVKAILGLCAEEWELFHETDGRGVTIIRTGSGLDSSYNVIASQKVVQVPAVIKTALAATSLSAFQVEYTQMQLARAANNNRTGPGGNSPEQSGQDW